MMTCLSTTRRHDVQFRADGQINLSSYVTRSLDLHPGDVIDIAYEQLDGIYEFYLYVVRRGTETLGRHLGACRRVNEHGDGFLRANSIALCRLMLDVSGEHQVVRVRAGAVLHHPQIGLCITLIISGER